MGGVTPSLRPALPPTTVYGSLVAPRRLGAAMQASRAASGTSLSELSRHSDGWWLPDELAAVERGAVELHDAEVMALTRLYGLRPAELPDGDSVALVVDRAVATEAPQPLPRPDAVADRLSAFVRLLGWSESTVRSWGDEIADAIDVAAATMRREIDRALASHAVVEPLARSLADRIAVAATGLLVTESAALSIVAVRRRNAGSAGGRGLPAGTLAAYLHHAASFDLHARVGEGRGPASVNGAAVR